MKYIALRNSSSVALVDDEDYWRCCDYRWRLSTTGYVVAHPFDSAAKTQRHLYLSRFLLNAPLGFDVDHINRDPLDNRRVNLRVVTRAQNMHNSWPRNRKKTSRFKGVHASFREKTGKFRGWEAMITCNRKAYHLGYYSNQEDAAKAYNHKAAQLFGEFACLNPV